MPRRPRCSITSCPATRCPSAIRGSSRAPIDRHRTSTRQDRDSRMSTASWPDIPGVTAVGGRPRQPRSPDVAVMGLTAELEGAANGGITLFDLVDKVERETRTERARAEGLAGWLPLSRVAAWDTDGRLIVDQVNDVYD